MSAINREDPEHGLKSAVRKRGPIKQFVENQWPGVAPCGLVRDPAERFELLRGLVGWYPASNDY